MEDKHGYFVMIGRIIQEIKTCNERISLTLRLVDVGVEAICASCFEVLAEDPPAANLYVRNEMCFVLWIFVVPIVNFTTELRCTVV